jgi:putative intracellular protease/amidase
MACVAMTCAWVGFGVLGQGRADGPDKPSATSQVALKGLDPVLLTEGKETKGQASVSVVRDGLRYLFLDTATKTKFEKDPGRYAIQLRGQCAMMPSAKARPDLFTVYKGRIYAFGSEGCQEAFRQEPDRYAHDRRTVVILIFEGMELLDFTGPAEVFGSAGFLVSTVAASKEPVTVMGLMTLTPLYTFADCPRADIIVIPGGSSGPSKDKRVIDWVVKASAQADATLSVCTGAFVLASAGLLDGKEATTHWGAINALRREFPKITVRNDRRVVDCGKVVTSAGVSAGIDGALHLVERLSGHSDAVQVARYMEYNWQPPSDKK